MNKQPMYTTHTTQKSEELRQMLHMLDGTAQIWTLVASTKKKPIHDFSISIALVTPGTATMK
jgi:hypothetical protein